jgi:glycosyltransferase involved in cell wall biosynthesis
MKINVLMFGWEFPPHISGGLGTASYGLTKGLAKHEVGILFVMPKARGDEDQSAVRIINASEAEVTGYATDEEFREFVRFVEVGSNLVPYLDPEQFEREVTAEVTGRAKERQGIYQKKYNFSGKYGANLMEEVARYALVGGSIAPQYDFDVIHSHDWLTYPAGIAAKRVSGKPLVVHVHATEFDRSGEGKINQQVYDIERQGMHAADLVITVSDLTRNVVIKHYGVSPEKVVTMHNAVDFQALKSYDREPGMMDKVVTFLGRVTYQKGPEYFIEAAKRVLKVYPRAHFVMAGSGDMLHRAIRRVAQLKMATHFHFTGFLTGEDVQRMFAQSHVYVMPSVSEPFGISPLEAMRAGVPTIISKQSGVAEILDYSIKVDYWDVDAMSDAIHGLLAYPALARFTARAGMEEVDQLKWEHVAEKIKHLYEKLIETRN